MTPPVFIWLAAGLSAVAAAAFAWLVPLPLPFDGFAALAAGGLACLGTVTLMAWAPPAWLWSDAERLRMAFQARHGLTGDSAENVLETISKTHLRAGTLRQAASAMRADMAEKVFATADRLDAAARELFYQPERLRDLRAVLIRSELIEDAAKAHAALRLRKQDATESASRQKLNSALDALQQAFEATDLMAARGLLAEVETASDVAETLLRPRQSLKTAGATPPADENGAQL